MTILFKNGTTNGVSPNIHESTGGQQVLAITGNFDAAAVEFQVQSPNDPNSEWVTNKTYISSSNDPITYLPHGFSVRGVISNAGASTDIFMEVRP